MAKPQAIKIPNSAVSMVSPRDYRLSHLCGYVVNFKKDVPINVPPMVYERALEIGARVVDSEAVAAPAPAVKPTIDPSVAEAAKLSAEAFNEAVDKAITLLITRNDPNDFKADNRPKVQKVVSEMAPEFAKPTATQVADAYERLQENIDLIED